MDANAVLGIIERWWAGRYSERHGIVTSYDPKKYIAKVTFQPEGQESGWLPIETGHIGEGYGVTIGLQPGQGGVNSQGQGGQAGAQQNNQGDQVIVRYQEGDFESGKIVQRVHSDQDKPPETQSGEIIIWTKFQKSGAQAPDGADGGQGGTGQQISFKKDGSLSLTDGNGATIQFDGNGNVVVTCKKFTVNASSDIKLISAANALFKGAAAILYATGNAFVKAVSTTNIKGASNLADPPITTGASDPPISS
jgi:hypothetical protein